LGITWMHLRRRPVIGWGLGAPHTERGLFRPRRGFLRQYDALITYSQRGAEEYRAAGFPAEMIFVAPNAVTHRPSQPPPARPSGFDGQATVLFVGRLQARKRIDNLLYACAALPSAIQPRLWIVGDGPARPDFENTAQQVYPAAEFLGARYGADLDALFTRADLFVLPGSGGLAVQQALSFALPVIVAEADGTQQDLVRPGNGWQVPANDIDALKQTLSAALNDPFRLRQMGAASYQIISQEINLENMVSVFLQALAAVAI
jgi:glycosyltransferase involved in cell wall biosynthesis